MIEIRKGQAALAPAFFSLLSTETEAENTILSSLVESTILFVLLYFVKCVSYVECHEENVMSYRQVQHLSLER